LFVTQSNREKIWVVGVEPPATGEERLDFIQDIAVLTGATPILRASDIETELAFSTLKNLKYLTPEHFGRARRVWVTQESTVISGGKADSRYLRYYIQDLQRRYERETDETAREKLRVRLGKFLGGSATLWIGGPSPLAIQQRKELAESASQALRNAIHSGVLAGGGAALLATLPDLQGRLRAARGLEERTAFSILIRMVKEPARTLLANAGLNPEPILDEVLQAGPGVGYDLRTGQIGHMLEAGIYDGVAALQMAVRTAVSTAAKDPEVSEQAVSGEPVLSLAAAQDGAQVGKTVFAGSASGLSRSADGGATWQPALESLALAEPVPVVSVAVSPSFMEDRTVIAGVPGGALRSTDGGASWQVLPFTPPPPYNHSPGLLAPVPGGRRYLRWNR
jgi:chaperonin GroEL